MSLFTRIRDAIVYRPPAMPEWWTGPRPEDRADWDADLLPGTPGWAELVADGDRRHAQLQRATEEIAAAYAREDQEIDALAESMTPGQARDIFGRAHQVRLDIAECDHDTWEDCAPCQDTYEQEIGTDLEEITTRQAAARRAMLRHDPAAVTAADDAVAQAESRADQVREQRISDTAARMSVDEARQITQQYDLAYHEPAYQFPHSRDYAAANRVLAAAAPDTAEISAEQVAEITADLEQARAAEAEASRALYEITGPIIGGTDTWDRYGQASNRLVEARQAREALERSAAQLGVHHPDAATATTPESAGTSGEAPGVAEAMPVELARGRAQKLEKEVMHAYTLDNTPRGFINPECEGDQWGFDGYGDLIMDTEAALRAHLLANPELETDREFRDYYGAYREEIDEAYAINTTLDEHAAEVDRAERYLHETITDLEQHEDEATEYQMIERVDFAEEDLEYARKARDAATRELTSPAAPPEASDKASDRDQAIEGAVEGAHAARGMTGAEAQGVLEHLEAYERGDSYSLPVSSRIDEARRVVDGDRVSDSGTGRASMRFGFVAPTTTRRSGDGVGAAVESAQAAVNSLSAQPPTTSERAETGRWAGDQHDYGTQHGTQHGADYGAEYGGGLSADGRGIGW